MSRMKYDTTTRASGLAPTQATESAKQSHHLWCIHCERAYPYGDFRRVDTRHLCPFPDCVGAAALAWDWERVRKVNPDYPIMPTPGVVYPLFGKGIYSRRIGDGFGIER